MKKNDQRLWKVFLVLLVFLAGHSSAQLPPLECNISLVENTIYPYEPVVVHYRFHNASMKALKIYTEDDPALLHRQIKKPNWINFTSFNPFKPNTFSDARDQSKYEAQEIGLTVAMRTLVPGGTLEGDYVLSQDYEFRSPGNLKFTVGISLPAKSANAWCTERGYEFRTQKVLTLKILPVSRARLLKTATKWYKEVNQSHGEKKRIALEVLFSLPEWSALNYWTDLAQNSTSECLRGVGEQLKRLGTERANSLLQIVDNRLMDELEKDPQYLQSRREAEEADKKEREKDAPLP